MKAESGVFKTLTKLIERIYEDQVLGNISAERYARMSINYENEQRELVKRVDEDEKRLVSIEQTSLDPENPAESPAKQHGI